MGKIRSKVYFTIFYKDHSQTEVILIKINKANSSKIITSLWNTHIPWNNYETETSLKQELYAFDKPLKKSIKLIATVNLNYTSIFISLAFRYIWGYQNWIYQPGFFSSKEQMSVFIILLLQILKFATMQHEI